MRHRSLKLAALGLVLFGAYGVSVALWGTWFLPKPTWQEWHVHREWEPGADRGAPREQWASQLDLYYDRMSCEASGRASLQKLQRMLANMALTAEQIDRLRMLGVPDPKAAESTSHLTEDGFSLIVVNAMAGTTSSTQLICLQVGQRPEGL